MDYLRNLGSAAVSTLVQKSGLNLPFVLGSKLPQIEGYFCLYDATKRDDGSPVSVFEYDLSIKNVKPFAQNAVRKLRTTRHPDILKFMDVVESDSTIYIMTERVRPLSAIISQYSSKSAEEQGNWLLWGLQKISVAVAFINDQCLSTHGKICVNAIFISPSGEWKLGGFEVFSNPRDDNAVLYTLGGLLPGSSAYAPPEVKKLGWSSLKEAEISAADGYAFGLLLHATFNPSHPPPLTVEPPHPPPGPSSRGSIPAPVFALFKKLLNPNPKMRLSAKNFLESGMMDGGFFATNRLVQVCSSLDNFTLSSEVEKNSLLKTLKESASSFPPEFASHRVLPSLISALEFGGVSASTLLPLVLLYGANVSPVDIQKVILGPIVKLYASPDRGTRIALLDHLPEYVDKLDKKAVSEKIFPHLQLGFSDTVAPIREATVKSIILFAPKFTDRILNNDLLRLLAKTQMDVEPSIRTNTCILLGRLAPSLGYNTKQKVLVPAFSRALKDPFVHARVAGLMAFMAAIDCFEVPDLASKVIPALAFTLVDNEKLVRDQAFKALDLFVKKIQEHAAQMPETVSSKDGENALGNNVPVPATLVTSAAGAAGSLAGWAISSISKLGASDMQVPIGSRLEKSDTVRDPLVDSVVVTPTSTTATPSLSPMPFKAGSLQLRPNAVAVSLADQLAEEAAATSDLNFWGVDSSDVKMDDDWGDLGDVPTVSPTKQTETTALFNPAARIVLSKEERTAEMARRKEERKQRIAVLKEQKKVATKLRSG